MRRVVYDCVSTEHLKTIVGLYEGAIRSLTNNYTYCKLCHSIVRNKRHEAN